MANKKTVYQIHVKTKDGWEAVRPTGGEPYEYEDEDEAIRTVRITNPDGVRIQKIVGLGVLTKKTDHPVMVVRVVEVTK